VVPANLIPQMKPGASDTPPDDEGEFYL
jgi:hypothetical protein